MERALNLNLKNADQESWSFFEIQYRTEYEYDSFSNLKKVKFPDGKIVEYKTDAMNRRVKKIVNGSVKEYYVWYDQQRLAAILDENKAPKLIYLYGPESGHSPSYLIKNNKTYKLVQDAGTGSIRYIVDPTNIYVVQELEYDEFGNIMRNSNPSYQPVLFAGGLYDEDTKLVKFGARDYDPTIGRWTTKDPIGFAGGDTNLYNYVANNPLSYIDPTGLVLEDTLSRVLTPKQQAVFGGALVFIGGIVIKGVTPTLPGLGMLLGGGLLMYEGAANVSTAIGRELGGSINDVIVKSPVYTPRYPASPIPPTNSQEGNQCPRQ